MRHDATMNQQSTLNRHSVTEQPSEARLIEQLAFKLGEEEYAVDILRVQEIRDYGAVTRIAGAPGFIKGVINLRGVVIPIVDMRIHFGLGTPVYNQFTVVIILEIAGRIVGMVVDSVSDVITLSVDEIRPAPEMGSSRITNYLMGLASVGERMLILLDVEGLMTSSEVGLIEKIAA